MPIVYRRTCSVCTLPRATAEDLARWRTEVGVNTTAPEPPWAAELCWTKPEHPCGCKVPPACALCGGVRRGTVRSAAGIMECVKCRTEPAREARDLKLERSYEPMPAVGGLRDAINRGAAKIGVPKAKRAPILAPARARTKGATLHRVPMSVDGRTLDRDEAKAAIAAEPWASGARYLGSTAGYHLFETIGDAPADKLTRPKRGQHGADIDELDGVNAAIQIFDDEE